MLKYKARPDLLVHKHTLMLTKCIERHGGSVVVCRAVPSCAGDVLHRHSAVNLPTIVLCYHKQEIQTSSL